MKHEDLIRQMTLAEKAALLSGADVWHTRAIPRLGIPSIALSDGPSGLRKQAGEGDHLGLNASTKATCIPSAATIANSWDPSVAEAMGAVVGADAVAQDVQVLLAPGLNTKRSSLCGRSFEYYSEDPYLAGKLAAGYIRGVQSKGVAACAKHFAANSQELLRMHSDSVMDERTLREMYLTNFEIAVKEGKPRAVMTSYNRLNGVYTNENTHLYDILRGEWGWDGMVVTDWGGSNDFVEGVHAGMNLEMPGCGDDSAAQLVKAVGAGRIDEAVVDERVDHILDLILAERAPAMSVDVETQHRAVREAAEKCVVLLKNDGGLLPLSRGAKVAVIGDFAMNPRFQGAGSSMVNPAKTDDPSELFVHTFPNCVGCAQGFERDGTANDELATQAVALAKGAECVLLYLGLPESYETEGLDREHMRLPENQIALLKAAAAVNPHIAVVLSCGSAVETPWLSECQALVYGCLGGQAVASAMLNMLTGEVNPGGKLAETFPAAYDEMPVSRYYPGREATSEYREGIYVGYRWFVTAGAKPAFPFGFGLSYTRFEYANLSVDEGGASFDVINAGERAGDEIAQLYVSLPGAKVFRPARELKGFIRLTLDPGETRRVNIPFDDYTFRYFNVATGCFEAEGGAYEIQIGASSEDIRLSAVHEVKGTGAANPYVGKPIGVYIRGEVMNVPDVEFAVLLGRDIPQKKWDRNRPLDMNDTVRQMSYPKNPVARLVYKVLTNRVDKAVAAGKPDLNLLFIYNIPFRGMAKMMGGMVSMDMARDILFMVNGHWHRGLFRLIRDWFKRPTLDRE